MSTKPTSGAFPPANSGNDRPATTPWKYGGILLIVLAVVWLLWSGHYEPFMLLLGTASCCGVVTLSYRMGVLDSEGVPSDFGVRPFLFYAPWLIKEILQANVQVCRRILDPKLPISPRLVTVRATQQTELARVILANSITLTPGTVSVDMWDREIRVHALSLVGAEADMSGEMNRRVTALERE